MIKTFQLTPEMNSFIQIFVGVIIMFNNGFVVVWLRQRFNEEFLLTMGATTFVNFSLIFLATSPSQKTNKYGG